MASRIIGVDLGAYSIKIAVANPGFRQLQNLRVLEVRVPDGDSPHLVRSAAVLSQTLSQLGSGDDAIFASLAGDQVFLHVLEFGFKSLKRADLERAVGAELEGQLPIDLEDMVYTFEQLPKIPAVAPPEIGPAMEDDEPTFVQGKPVQHGMVAAPPDGMRLLAAAALRSRAEDFLVALSEYRIDPRGLLATPAPYARFAERVVTLQGGAASPVAVLDVGHQRSDFCVVHNGRPVFARSIKRGGHHLTRCIARAWNLDYERAETAKHEDGMIGSTAFPPTSEAWMRVSQVLSKELGPLARDLRRTINACRAKTGFSPSRVILVGGTSRLRGLDAFLTEQVHLPVERLDDTTAAGLLGEAASSASADTAALALGLSLEGASGRPTFDLRQGSLAVRADLSFLRQKIPYLLASALAVIAFGVVSAWTGLSKLRDAEEILDRRVALESAEAFHEQVSAEGVLTRVGPVEGGAIAANPIPKMTAYDIFLAFNEALPPKDKATLDVEDLEIKQDKLVVKATSSPTGDIDALGGIKNLEQSLRESDCFKEFESPEKQPGKNDSLQFTLSIATKCKE
jgi:Tfp pilus assembly PilM family ATPase